MYYYYAGYIIKVKMSRKSCVCHICGIETVRFADHIYAAHKMVDHHHQKRVREERDRLLSRSSFTSDLQIEAELNALKGDSHPGLYSLDHFITYLKSKGFVVEELKNSVRGTESQAKFLLSFNIDIKMLFYCIRSNDRRI